jgi:hypothetical protein
MPIPSRFFDRRVIQLQPEPESGAQRLEGVLSNFLHHEHIVLLGEPGAGKTVLFEQFAAYEQTKYTKLGSFNRKPADQITNNTLYLDGLDECRAGNRHQSNAINDVVKKLFAINPGKVRISCRERDWLGSTDLAAFNDFFDDRGSTVVLKLEPLSEQEQAELLLDKGIESPSHFLSQAATHGLNEFLGNPLTLGMLAETVAENNWPTSRTELFEQFSLLLLREKNTIHAEEVHCSDAEMTAIAGSLMAHQLLSGIECYSLNSSDHCADQPFYKEISEYQPNKILRVLNSRLFYCDPENQTTSYFHRTVAEYLAAKCLAGKLSQGLPLGRVCALLGLDGYPTIELKGLYAWMPIFSPENALHFINNDPYGVMTYGDVGLLDKHLKLALLHALIKLSKNDPWFHSRSYSDTFARGFITSELKTELVEIVATAETEFHLRILLVDLIARSTEINNYKDLLSDLLGSPRHELAIRSAASNGLVESDISASDVRSIYEEILTEAEPEIALIENIVVDFYERVFNVKDVMHVLGLVAQCKERLPIGTIWGLRERLSPTDSLFLLETLNLPVSVERLEQNDSEIEWLVRKSLEQVLQHETILQLTPNRIWNILQKYRPLSEESFVGLSGVVTSVLREKPELLTALIDAAFEWCEDAHFNKSTFHYIRSALHEAPAVLQLSLHTYKVLRVGRYHESKSRSLYALALEHAFGESEEHQEITKLLWELAEHYSYLLQTREQIAVSEISALAIQNFNRIAANKRERLAIVEQNKQEFEKNRHVIKRGERRDWLNLLGNVYWGMYSSSDRKLSPQQRLLEEFGPELLPDVLEAILSAAIDSNRPKIHDVIECIGTGAHYEYWRCYLAAITEIWLSEQTLAFSDDDLKVIILIEALCPVFGEDGGNRLIHPWLKDFQQTKPKFLAEIYELFIEHTLNNSSRLTSSLERLMGYSNLEPYRKAVLISLLKRFDNIPLNCEQQLLSKLLKTDYLLEDIASLVRLKIKKIEPAARAFWNSVDYLFRNISMTKYLKGVLRDRDNVVWPLIELIGKLKQSDVSDTIFTRQKINEILMALVRHFPNVSLPRSEYSGSRNVWDGAEFMKGLISRLSADPSHEATIVLTDLLAHPDFETYQSYLKHSLTQQLQIYRETIFQKPTWSQVVATLANRAPANAADLHALVTEHLRLLIREIKHSNLDSYKFFWNYKGKTQDSAKVEDDCRDVLLSLLRPKLGALGISAEPEGYMARSKRADIVVSFKGIKVPVELKRQQHRELWTASEQQLYRLYTTAPESQGYGVYGVFWFGEKYLSVIPSPPDGMAKPKTAIELEDMLMNFLPEDKKQKTNVVVFDLSGDY